MSARGRLAATLFLVGLLLAACQTLTPEQAERRTLVTASRLLREAGSVYDGAALQERFASRACKTARGGPASDVSRENVERYMKECAALGVPIPYNPYFLEEVGTGLHHASQAIDAAQATMVAIHAGPDAQAKINDAVTKLLDALGLGAKLGLKMDPNAAATELKR